MDEYYCTKCGAILDFQYGFDPEKSVWTCRECGQLLTDDTGYEGERFKDIAWFCDSCGAYLNRQDGFSDLLETWFCTECGYANSISEDNILDSTYVSRMEENDKTAEETFFCPNCGIRLNDQDLFDKNKDDYECAACGASLHHDYPSEEYSIEDSIPPHHSAYAVQVCRIETQENTDSPNARDGIKKRPIYTVLCYLCGIISVIAFYKVLLYKTYSLASFGTLMAILSLMFFVLAITPKSDKRVRIAHCGIRKSLFVFLCIIGMYKLPPLVTTFFEWLFSIWE